MALPVDDLKPVEVIEHRLVDLYLSDFHQARQEGRFYGVRPCGKNMGTVDPAWQFAAPVPTMRPEVPRILLEQGEIYIHARLVSEEDDLMELAPAEVLAECPFEVRQRFHPEQGARLKRPALERLALVKEAFGRPPRRQAIGSSVLIQYLSDRTPQIVMS